MKNFFHILILLFLLPLFAVGKQEYFEKFNVRSSIIRDVVVSESVEDSAEETGFNKNENSVIYYKQFKASDENNDETEFKVAHQKNGIFGIQNIQSGSCKSCFFSTS